MAEHPITFWQRISQEMSMFFRRLTQCLGNCFQPPDEDQLLRDGPSQSPSLENNFNASTVSMQSYNHHNCGTQRTNSTFYFFPSLRLQNELCILVFVFLRETFTDIVCERFIITLFCSLNV